MINIEWTAEAAPSTSTSGSQVQENYTPALLRATPDTIFVFGDNMIGRGKAGQATIRDEPNSFGIPTKRLPSMKGNAFFSDQTDEIQAVQEKLDALEGTTFVIPKDGIGTGLAQLRERSPKIAGMIHEFFEDNVEGYNGAMAPTPELTDKEKLSDKC